MKDNGDFFILTETSGDWGCAIVYNKGNKRHEIGAVQ